MKSNIININIDKNYQIVTTNIGNLIDVFESKLKNSDIKLTISSAAVQNLLTNNYNELITNLYYRNAFRKSLGFGNNNFTTNIAENTLEERVELTQKGRENLISSYGIIKDKESKSIAEYTQELIMDVKSKEVLNYKYTFATKNLDPQTKITTFFMLEK